MPRPPDKFLKTPEFKKRLDEADAYVDATGLDMWATRIFWVGLSENVLVARRYAMRRPNYTESSAWAAYSRLVDAGIFCEEPEGIVSGLDDPYWGDEANCYEWMNTCIQVAAGGDIPDDLPRREP